MAGGVTAFVRPTIASFKGAAVQQDEDGGRRGPLEWKERLEERQWGKEGRKEKRRWAGMWRKRNSTLETAVFGEQSEETFINLLYEQITERPAPKYIIFWNQ